MKQKDARSEARSAKSGEGIGLFTLLPHYPNAWNRLCVLFKFHHHGASTCTSLEVHYFSNYLFMFICSILAKVEDLTTGLSNFSLKINTSSPIEEVTRSLQY